MTRHRRSASPRPATPIVRALLAGAALLAACSDTGGGANTPPDAATDVTQDLPAPTDLAPDVTQDLPAPIDAAMDAALDAAEDAAPDVAEDAAPDASPDVAEDAAPDAAEDAAPDAAPDAAEDVAPDVAPDVPADLGPTCREGTTLCGSTCADLQTDVARCGACATACASAPHAVPTCAAGRCGFACELGFGDCDADPTNGCEVDTRASLTHCGACSRACAPANATGACAEGACAVAACGEGFADCDMAVANGCEVDTRRSATSCGRCGNACAAGTLCNDGRCAPTVSTEMDRNLSVESITPGRVCADAPSYGVDALSASAATLAAPAGCLAADDLVLLINVQGAPGATPNVGNHELLTVESVEGAAVRFRRPKTRRYGSGADDDANIGGGAGQQRVVLQRVPVYGDLTVRPGVTLTVDAWDGRRGGVLALRASQLLVDGALSVVSRGFRSGRYSIDDGSCSESLATDRGESIEGPSEVTLVASAGASGGLGAAGGVSFNGETPLSAAAGHAVPGEEGQYPNGRTLGAPGGTYGTRDGTRVTLGSGAGGNVTCRGGSGSPVYGDPSSVAGGAIILDADTISLGATGAIDASAGDGGRTAASGGYVLLRANTLSLNEGLVRARGGTGVADNRSGRRTNRAGDGYVAVRYRDAVTGTTAPVATATRVP